MKAPRKEAGTAEAPVKTSGVTGSTGAACAGVESRDIAARVSKSLFMVVLLCFVSKRADTFPPVAGAGGWLFDKLGQKLGVAGEKVLVGWEAIAKAFGDGRVWLTYSLDNHIPHREHVPFRGVAENDLTAFVIAGEGVEEGEGSFGPEAGVVVGEEGGEEGKLGFDVVGVV